jgi:aminopeptidase N
MLDEALANYGALRAVEQISGAAAAENFRRGGDGLGGRRDGVRLIAAGFDAPLADLPHAPEFYTLSDSKGYLVYDMLARRIGRDRFEDALKDLHCAHRFGDIAWEKVERKLREAAGKQAADFFEQWFYREGMPILSLDWSQSGTEVILSVTQSGEPYTLQLPLRLVFDDGGAAMRSIDIAGARTDVKFKEVRRLRSIELDPQATIFFATPASRADALRRAPVTRGKLFWDNGETEKAVIEFKSALSTAGAADATPTEFLALVYLGWIAEEAGRSGEAEQCYRAALALPVRDQQLLKRAYKNLARVLQQKGDGEEAQRALLNAEAAQGVSDW